MRDIGSKDVLKEIKALRKQVNTQLAENKDKTIEHFGKKDIVISFFGALIVASGFIFKGNILLISHKLSFLRLFWIIIATVLIILAEIYFIGYSRVRNKKKRPFMEFAIKRVVTVYAMCLFVGGFLAFLYNLHHIEGNGTAIHLFKIAVAISFPASIGATLTDLFKKF